MTNTNKRASEKQADFGPGDLVVRSHGGAVFTVVGFAGEDILCAVGRVKCGGMWRPDLYDWAFHWETLTNLSL